MSKDIKPKGDAGADPASSEAPVTESAIVRKTGARAGSRPPGIAAPADASVTRAYKVTVEGRTTGGYRKAGEEIRLTEKQAQFLLLGGHITDPSKPEAKEA